jgi:hypothetical protein
MKRITTTIISAASIVCLLALGSAGGRQAGSSILAPKAHAQEDGIRNGFDQGRTRNCSTGILRGRYGLSLTGTIVGLGPAAEIGSITFDGAGSLSGTLTASFNGQSVPRTATGTYVVNPDCTGTIAADVTPGGPINLNLVAVDAAGHKALLIVTTPGLIFSGSIETQ